ncbi:MULTISPECIES: efflux RND transporter periplasmic adaptor subunit [Corallococcus]|uniref:efflux RND transporter periplasmic adaptor subunit n=1 Tax=Corallococcus TaxID=83461 RepID=UPI00117CF6D5|nr:MULTISPECIES: efflux RND transporter periplasmic adaptor subunit [Corallococcus]NBD07566.1 efflux RND transporter periplasmic adaptor subunit [Corallococcus silvisoli]TSC33572.1 efflux RND transporter periplasmic adaptor subunit [Corallococcus sp. Z5C101001]
MNPHDPAAAPTSTPAPARRTPVWMAFAGAGLLGTGVLFYALAPTDSSAESETALPGPTVKGETVHLPDGAPQWHYVQLAVATEGSALTPLPSPARVQFDEARTASVGAPLAGRVQEVRVRAGDRVKQGDDLFSVRSGAYAELLREQRGAEAELAEKRRNADRLQELVALRAAPEKDLLAARTELRQAELSLEAAKAKQGSLRVSSRGENLFWVTAPRSGTVVDLDVVASQEVTPDRERPLVRLSDLDQVMVVADLQESDALDMSPGQDVTVTTRDGIVRAGKVDRVAEVVDPLRRTVEVRVRVPNDDRRFRPNAFVEVTPTPPTGVRRVRVPDSAVVTDGARSVVFVARDSNRLERVPVTPGRRRDGEVELRGGLASGDRFVARGALLLENQIELAD